MHARIDTSFTVWHECGARLPRIDTSFTVIPWHEWQTYLSNVLTSRPVWHSDCREQLHYRYFSIIIQSPNIQFAGIDLFFCGHRRSSPTPTTSHKTLTYNYVLTTPGQLVITLLPSGWESSTINLLPLIRPQICSNPTVNPNLANPDPDPFKWAQQHSFFSLPFSNTHGPPPDAQIPTSCFV